jgi:hypothetical protein
MFRHLFVAVAAFASTAVLIAASATQGSGLIA